MTERLPDHVDVFRRQYRREHIGPRYRGWIHLSFTSLASLGVIALAISRLGAVTGLEWLAVPLSFVAANLGEYMAHRWPMHRPFRLTHIVFERHARQHHRFYTHDAMAAESGRDFHMILLPPALFIFFVLVFALPIGTLLFALVSPDVGWLFVATSVGYFLLYEWLHCAYHLPPDGAIGRLPPIRRLRRLHTTHHDPRNMRWWNFNITFPIADKLFGSYRRDD